MTGFDSKRKAALDEEGMYLVHQTQPAQVKVEGPLHVVCQCDKCKAQPAQEPVAWQWLGSAHFRKKLPKNADITAWNPLYTTPPAAQPVGQVPCVRHCESTAYEIVIRGLKGDIERMKAAQRTWVELDRKDKWEIVEATERDDRNHVMALVEAKLKEKNNAA